MLTLAPFDHTAISHMLGCGQPNQNSLNVVISRPEKVSGLQRVKLVPSAIIDLRRTLKNCSPYPHDKMNGLLRADRNSNELLVTHHAGVVTEPPTHGDTLAFTAPQRSSTSIG